MSNRNPETITAVATPPGRGGVGIIRVSGPLSSQIAEQMLGFVPLPRQAKLCQFLNNDNNPIDEGIALYFPNPNSFTGEDVLELQGHGGPVVMDLLLQRILSLGARLAEPGEFSQRAFLNDKMDLVQVEAVADLIDAASTQAAKSAMHSLQGDFSKTINSLVLELTQLRMMVEAAIDFPDEEIDFLAESDVVKDIIKVQEKLTNVLETTKQGVILRDGLNIVIAGKPNAGKSTLLNCLAGRDVAIVTDVAGTTRDILKEYIHIDGMPLHIIDTAGLRDSADIVEQEGMRRAWDQIHQADLVLLIIDATDNSADAAEHLDSIPEAVPVCTVFNKVDLSSVTPKHVIPGASASERPGIHKNPSTIYISAKTGEGINTLKNQLKTFAGYAGNNEGTFTARRRHLDAITRGQEFINAGIQQFTTHHAGELLAEDLRLAQQALSEITGEFTADDLLGEIFSSFCIGK